MKSVEEKAAYHKGYQAGLRRNKVEQKLLIEQRERVYMDCLRLAVEQCDNWTIGKKKVNNTDMYCQLARHFADKAISQIKEMG